MQKFGSIHKSQAAPVGDVFYSKTSKYLLAFQRRCVSGAYGDFSNTVGENSCTFFNKFSMLLHRAFPSRSDISTKSTWRKSYCIMQKRSKKVPTPIA